MKLNLIFGTMVDSIAEQLRKQNFSFDAMQVQFFEQMSKAIITIEVNGLTDRATVIKMERRLINQIRKHVLSKNKC